MSTTADKIVGANEPLSQAQRLENLLVLKQQVAVLNPRALNEAEWRIEGFRDGHLTYEEAFEKLFLLISGAPMTCH